MFLKMSILAFLNPIMFFCKENNTQSDHVHKLCNKHTILAHIILIRITIVHVKRCISITSPSILLSKSHNIIQHTNFRNFPAFLFY